VKRRHNLRVNSIYFIFLSLFIALFLKISYLQIFKKNFLDNLSQEQYYKVIRLEGERGDIFDRKGITLATGIPSYSIFADPRAISHPKLVAELLSLKLGLGKKAIYGKIKDKRKRFVWIKRKVSWEEKKAVESLNLKGVSFIRKEKRFYPQGSLASHILGRVDIDNQGIEGIELFYDSLLRGKNGWAKVLQDSSSREVIFTPEVLTPQKGIDLILTLDAQMQYWSETYLAETVKKFNAKGGSVIVMDASGGDILALANYPTFAPNRRDLDNIKNIAICNVFEPGSVFKVITLLAAIEENRFSDEDKFFCENGKFKIPGTILHDWKPYGELTFKEVFKKSSNIGVSKIANYLGRECIYNYIRKLGFGEKTEIDLPGEVRGIVKPPEIWSRTSEYVIPIGQEIGVTLIQLVRAFAAVVNGGYLVRPHLLKSMKFKGGYKDYPIEKIRVISPLTAERARRILREVVEEGTGKRARLEGIEVGGKTGTAQKFDLSLGKYSHSKYQATFVGFINEFNIPLVIGVTIDEPVKSHFGGVVAAPLFKKVAQKVIQHLEGEIAFKHSSEYLAKKP
jgi:cell division protein FtsI (penicillin-binding protein 3)